MIRSSDSKNFRRLAQQPSDRSPAVGIQRPRALYTATGGETSLDLQSLSPQISYNPGRGNLDVKSTLGQMIAGIDFQETSSTTITFTNALQAGEVLEITQTVQFSGNLVAEIRPDEYSVNNVTAGTTSITTDFSWPYNLNPSKRHGGIRVFINGILQQRNALNAVGGDADYYENQIGSLSNTNQITFNTAMVGGENITVVRNYQAVDETAASTQFNNTRLSELQNTFLSGFQAFVDENTKIAVPYTTIQNRAQIPDLSQDLKARFGIDRVMVQSAYQLQNEFGPNGEPVWAALNDDRGLVRFVGSSWTNTIDASAPGIIGSAITDYVEISFYGTGLNLLFVAYTNLDFRVSIDGGTEGSNITAENYSTFLVNRNHATNNVLPVVSGLSLGLHTVKLRINNATGGIRFYGFEILNERTNLLVPQGIGYAAGRKLQLQAASTLALKPAALTGTRGGRVVVYLDTDGTVKQAVQATNTAAAYLTSADHTNEEVARTYHWREFGAGRGDDFSLYSTSSSTNLAFTLDDGTTTLVGSNVSVQSANNSYISISVSGYLTVTFVGTGLDIIRKDDANGGTDTYSVTIDGTNQGNLNTSGSTTARKVSLASGLTYGTHTIKITRVSAVTFNLGVGQFIVYQPKTPSLPSGAIKIADYNVMADFVANSTAGVETIATGVLRKQVSQRESVYVNGTGGTTNWSLSAIDPLSIGGWNAYSDRTNSYLEYTFFGTGFEFRFNSYSDRSTNISVTLNGLSATTANFPSMVSSTYGTGVNFTSGTLDQQDAALTYGSGLRVSGLPLAKYTVKFNNNTASSKLLVGVLDIIPPIHSHKSNLYADLQNTLPVGSNSISDCRQITPIKDALPAKKAWAQAVGITSSPTTTSTSAVPMPDMSLSVKTKEGFIRINYSCQLYSSGAFTCSNQIYVDGVAVGVARGFNPYTATASGGNSDSILVPVSAGIHKIDLYWFTSSGTMTAASTNRILNVEES